MLDENRVTGSSGVILGKRDNGQQRLQNIELGKEEIPATCLTQVLGEGNNRAGLLDCNPRYDHDGKRWEDIGLEYANVCNRLVI